MFNIYSGTESVEITNKLNIRDAMSFNGSLTSDELNTVLRESDVFGSC